MFGWATETVAPVLAFVVSLGSLNQTGFTIPSRTILDSTNQAGLTQPSWDQPIFFSTYLREISGARSELVVFRFSEPFCLSMIFPGNRFSPSINIVHIWQKRDDGRELSGSSKAIFASCRNLHNWSIAGAFVLFNQISCRCNTNIQCMWYNYKTISVSIQQQIGNKTFQWSTFLDALASLRPMMEIN